MPQRSYGPSGVVVNFCLGSASLPLYCFSVYNVSNSWIHEYDATGYIRTAHHVALYATTRCSICTSKLMLYLSDATPQGTKTLCSVTVPCAAIHCIQCEGTTGLVSLQSLLLQRSRSTWRMLIELCICKAASTWMPGSYELLYVPIVCRPREQRGGRS